MKIPSFLNPSQRRSARVVLQISLILAVALAIMPFTAQSQSKSDQEKDKKSSNKSVGFVLSAEATAKDLGLPIYPGARQVKDSSEDSSALNVGLWGGSSAFRLVVLKLELSLIHI